MKDFRVRFFLMISFLILAATSGLILFARGYKLDFDNKTLQPTGLLVTTSNPDGASVFVNGKLTTATNDTVPLPPESYEVEIKKDGYFSWKKALTVKKEVVTKADAYLFPIVADFRPLTYTSAQNPLPSPDGTKAVYAVPFSGNDELAIKAGIWVIDLTDGPLGLGSRSPRQILKSASKTKDYSQFDYQWSSDSRQILLTSKTENEIETNFLISANELTESRQLIDITAGLPITIKQWQKDTNDKKIAQLSKLPEELAEILESSTDNLVWSPDETKILYTATAGATIPDKLTVQIPGSSTQKQERDIKPGEIYTYDIKQDRNFYVMNAPEELPIPTPTTRLTSHISPSSLSLQWLPTSKHLVFVEPEKISIMDYDASNKQEIYKGFFEYPFVFPAAGADKLILLTRLTSDEESPLNLYALSLR